MSRDSSPRWFAMRLLIYSTIALMFSTTAQIALASSCIEELTKRSTARKTSQVILENNANLAQLVVTNDGKLQYFGPGKKFVSVAGAQGQRFQAWRTIESAQELIDLFVRDFQGLQSHSFDVEFEVAGATIAAKLILERRDDPRNNSHSFRLIVPALPAEIASQIRDFKPNYATADQGLGASLQAILNIYREGNPESTLTDTSSTFNPGLFPTEANQTTYFQTDGDLKAGHYDPVTPELAAVSEGQTYLQIYPGANTETFYTVRMLNALMKKANLRFLPPPQTDSP